MTRKNIALVGMALCFTAVTACGSPAGTDSLHSPSSTDTTSAAYAVETVHKEAQFGINIGDQREVAGAASNVFVAKVDAVSGTKSLSPLPSTQFKVTVLKNLKGNVGETATVYQEAGTDKATGKFIAFDGDKLLTVGKSYVLAATLNKENGWYTISAVTGHTELNPSDSTLLAKSSTATPPAVSGWLTSIKNQKLPK